MTTITQNDYTHVQKNSDTDYAYLTPYLSSIVPSEQSLLNDVLENATHIDGFEIHLPRAIYTELTNTDTRLSASQLLAKLLQGFINNPPPKVSRLMRIRNVLVSPLRLRTAELGCPVSSLQGRCSAPQQYFAHTFPVLAQQSSSHHAEVLLGADDKHLRFRSSVSVYKDAKSISFTLATKVAPKNWFGRFYMWAIYKVHTGYIEPTMLKYAVADMLVNRLHLGHVNTP